MTWLGWCLVAVGLSLWCLGAWGFLDEVKQLFRSRGPGRDDDQGEHHGGDRGGGGQ